TLKNLDSRGNQATWSAEGDISSREDMYTGVGMAADYYFVEKTALIKQASLDALFKCGKDAEALKEVFTNSNNVAGKKAIMEFAG
ncbi:DUF1202 family protein, partial [Salmonella enterica subsp. enterica serovar Kentucky]|nr:DUF1202 family protein [Salmonella enterica subsp. enterica serovar Kentucky]